MSNKSFKLKISEIVAGTVSGFSDEGLAQIIGQTYEDCSTDPNWANVVLMLHLDQEGGNPVGFIDETGKEVKPFGGTQIVSTPSKFGSHVGYFNGQSNSYLTVSDGRLALGSGDFTIEGWIHTTTVTGYQIILDFRPVSTQGAYLCLYIQGGVPKIFVNSADLLTSSTAVSINTWTHIACCKKSGVLYLFLNGNLVGSVTDNNTYLGNTVSIGRNTQLISNTNFTGYIDELRITKGVARYDSNPTKLLLHFDEITTQTGFIEETGKVVTVNGTTTVSNTQSKFGGYSGYFAGSGDNIRIPNHADLNFGSSDFTVEFWMYRTAMDNSIVFAKGLFALNTKETGTVWLWCSSNGSSNDIFGLQIATGIALNTWYHIALVRSGLTWRFFVNGSLTWTGASSAVIYADSNDFIIGTDTSNTYQYKGYLDEFRITKGKALYDYIQGDALLLHFDSSGGAGNNEETGKTITILEGSPVVSSSVKKFGEKSLYLDGGSAIQFLDSSLALSNQDFTVEFWAYYVASGTDHVLNYGQNASGLSAITFYNGNVYFSDGASWILTLPYPGIAGNTWTHFAITRQGNTIKIYSNGVQYSTGTLSGSLVYGSNGLIIGDYAGQPYKGYVDELRVSDIARYTSNFTPSNTPFSVDANTKLLAHFEGTMGPLPITDESGKAVTRPWGSATISAEQFKFGGYSGKFLATDAIRIANTNSCFVFNSDFTIEFFFMATAWHENTYLFDFGANGCMFRYYGGIWNFYSSYPTNPFNYTTAAPTLNQWYHYAIVRSGSTVTFYINGTSVTSGTFSGTCGNADLTINGYGGAAGYGITGYFDEFRIVNGTAKYTSNFTVPTQPFVLNPDTTVSYASNPLPPTAPFTYEGSVISNSNPIPPTAAFPSCRTDLVITDSYRSNTTLLLNMNGLVTDTVFYDDGTNALSVTKSGNVAYNTTVHKFWNSSAYFSGGYLSVAHDAGLELGSGDFTIETWMYKTADTDGLIYSKRVNEATADNIGISPRSGGSINLYCSSNGGSWDMFAVAVATGMSLNTWYHIALTRSGSTWTFFVNGAVTWTGASSATIHPNTYSLCVGAERNGSYPFTGYLSDFRITKGISRYNSNSTKLLMHFDQNTDTSSLYGEETGRSLISGTAIVSNDSAIGSYSADFRNNAYLAINGSSTDIGLNDFVIEFYIKIFAFGSQKMIFGTWNWSGGTNNGWGIGVHSAGNLYIIAPNGWNSANAIGSVSALNLNTWEHVTITRTSGVVTFNISGSSALGTNVGIPGFNTVNHSNGDFNINMNQGSDFTYGRYTVDGTPIYTSMLLDNVKVTKLVNSTPTVILENKFESSQVTQVVFKEDTGKTVSVYGNASISSAQSKFGGYSGYFDGSGDYIQVASSPDLAVGTGDFTVEMWFYQTGFTGPQHSTLLSTSTSAGSWAGGFGINVSHWGVTNNLKMVDSTGNFLWNGNTVIQLNTWYHLAVVRKTGVTSCYLNGVLEGSASDSNNYSGYGNFRIGCDIAGGQFWMGYIDEIRILKGVAQYITNFTPPSQPYTYSGSVVLSGASAIPPADKLLK